MHEKLFLQQRLTSADEPSGTVKLQYWAQLWKKKKKPFDEECKSKTMGCSAEDGDGKVAACLRAGF